MAIHGFLGRACHEARARVASAARQEPAERIRERALAADLPPSFVAALRGPEVAIIAEVKRASPSRGPIADIPDPAALARSYALGGAAAVSVLTEPQHFRGSLADLRGVAQAAGLPVLRKDFVVDPYQVLEARAVGAAAVLLIVAALSRAALGELLVVTAQTGLDALVEAHDAAELATAVAAHADAGAPVPLIVGINARNLATLQVDPATFERAREAAPAGALLVAESGVGGPADVAAYAAAGADAVLVGEHLVAAPDPAEAVRQLREASRVLR